VEQQLAARLAEWQVAQFVSLPFPKPAGFALSNSFPQAASLIGLSPIYL
jgi:hypothetical protein